MWHMCLFLCSVVGSSRLWSRRSLLLVVLVNSIVELAATTQYLRLYVGTAAEVSLVVRIDVYMYGAFVARFTYLFSY